MLWRLKSWLTLWSVGYPRSPLESGSPGFTGGDTNWETGQTSYLFDKGGLTSGQTYAIYVQVSDASGLAT